MIMMLLVTGMNEFIVNLPYFAISRVISYSAISIFWISHLILHFKTWHFQQHKLDPNTNMYKRVYTAKDVQLSIYLFEIMRFLSFLVFKTSTVISTLLGCFKDIYFALTILQLGFVTTIKLIFLEKLSFSFVLGIKGPSLW